MQQASLAVIGCISACLAQAQRFWADVDAVCCALSGVDTQHDVNEWTESLAAALRSGNEAQATQPGNSVSDCSIPVYVCNDAIAALASVSPTLNGVAVVAGTGCIAVGCTRDGREVRIGGWGPLFGERGGGLDIGLQALAAIRRRVECDLADKSCGGLLEAVMRTAGVQDVPELVRWAYADASWSRVAALAPAITNLANQGVPRACAILDRAATAAADSAASAYRRLAVQSSCDSLQLVLVGGLLRDPASAFAVRVQAALERTRVCPQIFNPQNVHWCGPS